MRLLKLTLDSLEQNLALDEALLDQAEADAQAPDVLRLWEPTRAAVVVGRSSRVRDEVNVLACRRQGVPILRRCSGGAAIITGPGCLMYAVVLSLQRRPALRLIEQAHRFVLGKVKSAVERIQPAVELAGVSDLALDGRKFSGNSLRCKRNHLLYHGTLLYNFPLEAIGACLHAPPRQPDYRQGRAHADFVANLNAAPGELAQALADAWSASAVLEHWPAELTRRLVEQRYGRPEWHFRH